MADKKELKEEEDGAGPAEGEEGAEGAGEGDEEAAKRKKKRKMIIIAAIAAVLIGGGGSAVYFSGMLSGSKTEATSGKKDKKKKEKGSEEAPEHTTGSSVKAVKTNPNEWVPGVEPGHEDDDIAYYNLPEFLVNLDTNSKQTSFIKMKVTLESASDGNAAAAIDNRLPRIVDKFNETLRLLRISDISGSTGLYRLREELLLQVNKIINPAKVNDVLFQEIIVQ